MVYNIIIKRNRTVSPEKEELKMMKTKIDMSELIVITGGAGPLSTGENL